jgi:hypothetical protein
MANGSLKGYVRLPLMAVNFRMIPGRQAVEVSWTCAINMNMSLMEE